MAQTQSIWKENIRFRGIKVNACHPFWVFFICHKCEKLCIISQRSHFWFAYHIKNTANKIHWSLFLQLNKMWKSSRGCNTLARQCMSDNPNNKTWLNFGDITGWSSSTETRKHKRDDGESLRTRADSSNTQASAAMMKEENVDGSLNATLWRQHCRGCTMADKWMDSFMIYKGTEDPLFMLDTDRTTGSNVEVSRWLYYNQTISDASLNIQQNYDYFKMCILKCTFLGLHVATLGLSLMH